MRLVIYSLGLFILAVEATSSVSAADVIISEPDEPVVSIDSESSCDSIVSAPSCPVFQCQPPTPNVVVEMSPPKIVYVPSRRQPCKEECKKEPIPETLFGCLNRAGKTKIKNYFYGPPGPMPISTVSIPAYAMASVPITLQRTTYLTGRESAFAEAALLGRGGRTGGGGDQESSFTDDDIDRIARRIRDKMDSRSKETDQESGLVENKEMEELRKEVRDLRTKVDGIENALKDLCKSLNKGE